MGGTSYDVHYRPESTAVGGLAFGWSLGNDRGVWTLVGHTAEAWTWEDERGYRRTVRVVAAGERRFVHLGGVDVTLAEQPRFPDPTARVVQGGCVAPMPGKVVLVKVAAGDTVEAGAPLIVMEAMKMEHVIKASAAGTVTEVRVKVGEQVDAGQVLAVVEPAEGRPDHGRRNTTARRLVQHRQ